MHLQAVTNLQAGPTGGSKILRMCREDELQRHVRAFRRPEEPRLRPRPSRDAVPELSR